MSTVLHGNVLDSDDFDGAVLDLDGVLTRTARVHAAAWKQTFDEYLARWRPHETAFDIDSDYPRFVDGKPRLDGVRSFLSSRGIELSEGRSDDGPGDETVHGLGERKNRLYLERLRAEGAPVYESSIEFLRALRGIGIATAVVSSSRNCAEVLEAAGIAELFDARVDGRELARLGLAGKPAPDMFAEACRRLGIDPRRAVGVEDATAGVEAAKAAGLACVIGVDRHHRADGLRAAGADIVVGDLSELRLQRPAGRSDDYPSSSTSRTRAEEAVTPARLASALHCLDRILPRGDRRLAIFLDYDGTLAPIVSRPEDAVLGDAMRSTLQRLARSCQVAILSGRDLADVRERVSIPGIWYAGSHGFDIAGPAGERMELEEGADFLPVLDAAEQSLHAALDPVPGCQVERKRFAIAVHYRRVAEDDVARVRASAEETRASHPELRLATGKMIFELQPDIDWHKGRALGWLMQTLNLGPPRFVPVYVGDDETDEDAFMELASYGIGILVADEDQPTAATYRLDDPGAVEDFLGQIAGRLQSR